MTIEEAIKHFAHYIGNECYTAKHQEACAMAIAALRAQQDQESKPLNGWISVKDRLPEAEEEVLVCTNRNGFKIITNAMYEDGKMTTEDSAWTWYDHNFEYDEENDTFIIPEGWWECKHYNCDDEYNHCIDHVVAHWMPMPEPPEMEKTEE